MPIPRAIMEMLKKMPPFHVVGIERARKNERMMSGMRQEVEFTGSIIERTVTTAKRDTPLRIYFPSGGADGKLSPAVIAMHGGGFVMGGLDSLDGACRMLAQNTPCIVINIDYGLAPEHKFPEPVEECYDIARWLAQEGAALGIDSQKLAVTGDSAGANMSSALCLLARERKDVSFMCQVLFYPPVNLTVDSAEDLDGGRQELMLHKGDMRWFNEMYLTNSDDAKNPLVSPLFITDLSGIPQAFVATAGLDPLTTEARLYISRLREAGVAVTHRHFDEMVHAFLAFTGIVDEAKEALDAASEFLQKIFYSRH